MATNSFVQVPPDSTGKKLFHQLHTVDATPMQVPVVHVGCAAHPDHLQLVDGRGQAFTRFAEGSPTMDAFGNLRVSDSHVLGAYEYTNGDMADLFTDVTTTGGSITYNPQASEVNLAVTNANGAKAERSSNRYHYYQPGVGNLIIMTLALGDAGKVGNERYWGYGDDDNGLFWRLNGTQLQVVLRSNTSGTVVETVINQNDWNGDKLDGTGTSKMTLDVTKANFYWIDFAWLGVGEVRFGVLAPDGSRWVCHTFMNPNNNVGAYMASGSLPVHYENKNTALTSGTSEMRLICTAVYAEASTDYTFWRFSDAESGAPKTVTDTLASGNMTPIISLRPNLTHAGKINRVGLYPQCLSIYVSGGPIKLTILDDGDLTGAVWEDCEETAQIDKTATAVANGSKFHSYFLDAGSHHIDVDHLYEVNDEGYHVLFNGLDSYVMTLGAAKINPADTVTCSVIINYRELR